MRPHRLTAVLLASVLLLAGCAGAGDGGKETTAPADEPETAAPDSAPLLTAGVTDYALVYDLDGSGARSLAMAVAEVLPGARDRRAPVGAVGRGAVYA